MPRSKTVNGKTYFDNLTKEEKVTELKRIQSSYPVDVKEYDKIQKQIEAIR